MEDRANILRQMKVCRFCLSNEEEDLLNIHGKYPQSPDISIPLPSLPLQIMACIALEVVRNDGMPQYICKSCHYLTAQAYIFKTNCKKADDALKLFLVTGQLSKPYLQNVVQIKVQPASEKFISVIQGKEGNEKGQAVSIQHDDNKQSHIEFEEEEMEQEEEEEIVDDSFIEEDARITNTQPVEKTQPLKTSCFSCNQCDRSFPLKQLLDLHMAKHTRERNFECEVCNNKFYNKYDLQKHELTHNAVKEFACIVCNKTFNREAFLRRHERVHNDAPKFSCTQCDKSFLTKQYLDLHIQKHNKTRPFTCNVCGKSFVFKQGLERHEIIHNDNKPHKCNYCEASFISAIKLARHITSHAGLRPYPCKLCGRTFLLSHHLARHMRSHYASSAALDTGVGRYKCDICSMAFRKKDSLINHSAIHSMVNLKCVICNTMFETASLVKEHITTHLTTLPYPCEKCDYSFESEEQLEEHELKHAEMEYEDQIEKEVFSEALGQTGSQQSEEEDEDEVEEGEVRDYTIEDVNNPESGLRRSSHQETTANVPERDTTPRIQFLKDEVESEEEIEEAVQEEEEDVEIEPIKPIVRQEGTKVYQRKKISVVRTQPDIRLSSLKPTTQAERQQYLPTTQAERQQHLPTTQAERQQHLPTTQAERQQYLPTTQAERQQYLPTTQAEKQQYPPTTLSESISSELTNYTHKTMKLGEKVVKVQKFILTKDEMKAMAKQGILEVRGGHVVLKNRGQQILNATLKPIQKGEIDSILDKRSAKRIQIKRYENKNVSGDADGGEESVSRLELS